jgi:hypothetical protein
MRGIQFQRQEKIIKKYLLCLVAFFIASQTVAIEIEAPALLLTNVPAEIRVNGATPGSEVRLTVAARTFGQPAMPRPLSRSFGYCRDGFRLRRRWWQFLSR